MTLRELPTGAHDDLAVRMARSASAAPRLDPRERNGRARPQGLVRQRVAAPKEDREEFRFTFRCADCGVIAHGFSRPPLFEEARLKVPNILPDRWEARRLAAVVAAFVCCPACAGNARASSLRTGYWYGRLLLAVATRALFFATIAYLFMPFVPESWLRPTTDGLPLAAATLVGLFWAGLAGAKYMTAMRCGARAQCVRYD